MCYYLFQPGITYIIRHFIHPSHLFHLSTHCTPQPTSISASLSNLAKYGHFQLYPSSCTIYLLYTRGRQNIHTFISIHFFGRIKYTNSAHLQLFSPSCFFYLDGIIAFFSIHNIMLISGRYSLVHSIHFGLISSVGMLVMDFVKMQCQIGTECW